MGSFRKWFQENVLFISWPSPLNKHRTYIYAHFLRRRIVVERMGER